MTSYHDTLTQAVLDAEWYLADYPVAVRKDPRGDKKRSIFAAADLIRSNSDYTPDATDYGDLPDSPMTDAPARIEAALKWMKDYNDALDTAEIPPNGDDFNVLCNGMLSILQDGVLEDIDVKREGR